MSDDDIRQKIKEAMARRDAELQEQSRAELSQSKAHEQEGDAAGWKFPETASGDVLLEIYEKDLDRRRAPDPGRPNLENEKELELLALITGVVEAHCQFPPDDPCYLVGFMNGVVRRLRSLMV